MTDFCIFSYLRSGSVIRRKRFFCFSLTLTLDIDLYVQIFKFDAEQAGPPPHGTRRSCSVADTDSLRQ